MFTWLFWLMVLFALVDWLGSWRGWKTIRWVTKPGTLILLIAWFTQIGDWRGHLLWFGLGLVFSLAGDVLLHLSERLFMPGVGAFFLAHVCYIIGFLQSPAAGAQPFAFRWQILLMLAGIAAIYWLLSARIRAGLRQHGETSLTLPVMAYAGILSLMWLSALSTLLRPGWTLSPAALVSVGAGLFFLSDSMLAYDRFVRPLPASDLLVMVTYHLGQILIAAGVLGQYI